MGEIIVSGVVTMAVPIGEYDKRLVILTKERGRITVFSSGSRKPTSPFLAVCRPFVFAEFTLYEGKNNYRLKTADVKEYFDEMAFSLDTVTYGSYFLELASFFSEEYVEAGQTLNLLYLSFKALLNPSLDNRLVRVIMEMRILEINGEAPDVFRCQKCRKEVEDGFFSIRKQGIFCRECGKTEDTVPLSKTAVYTLQYILAAPIGRLFTFTIDEPYVRELMCFVKKYYRYHIGEKFHSLAMIPDEE